MDGAGGKRDPTESFPEAQAVQMSLFTVSFQGVLFACRPWAGCFRSWLHGFLKPFFTPGQETQSGKETFSCLICNYLELMSLCI